MSRRTTLTLFAAVGLALVAAMLDPGATPSPEAAEPRATRATLPRSAPPAPEKASPPGEVAPRLAVETPREAPKPFERPAWKRSVPTRRDRLSLDPQWAERDLEHGSRLVVHVTARDAERLLRLRPSLRAVAAERASGFGRPVEHEPRPHRERDAPPARVARYEWVGLEPIDHWLSLGTGDLWRVEVTAGDNELDLTIDHRWDGELRFVSGTTGDPVEVRDLRWVIHAEPLEDRGLFASTFGLRASGGIDRLALEGAAGPRVSGWLRTPDGNGHAFSVDLREGPQVEVQLAAPLEFRLVPADGAAPVDLVTGQSLLLLVDGSVHRPAGVRVSRGGVTCLFELPHAAATAWDLLLEGDQRVLDFDASEPLASAGPRVVRVH